jgi:hypothetical protein
MGFGLNKEDVRDDAEGLANMRHIGRSIAWLGQAIEPVKDRYPKI